MRARLFTIPLVGMKMLFLLLIMKSAAAQERIYNFEQFRQDRHLPSNTVRHIVQDKSGVIWMATKKGLATFNGINSRFFLHDASNLQSIGSNNLSHLFLDRKERIWIASYDNGLSCYNPKLPADSAFTNYLAMPTGNGLTQASHLYTIVEDNNGFIWCGGQDTDLIRVDPTTNSLSHIKLIPNSQERVTVYTLYKASDGDIWVGTRHHGYFRLNTRTYQTKQYNFHPEAQPWVTENGVSALFEQDGYLWFSYYDANLCRMNLTTENVDRNLLGIGKNDKFYDNAINAIVWGKEGKIYAGHNTKGLYVYDPATETAKLLGWDILTPEDPVADRINDIYQDTNGSIWLSTANKGLIRYTDYNNRFYQLLPLSLSSPIKGMQIAAGQIWYYTKDGLGVYDIGQKKQTGFHPLNGLWVSKLSHVNETIYLSTYDNGVWYWDTQARAVRRLPVVGESHQFEVADCNTILSDTIGGIPYLWIGAWNSGIYQYNVRDKSMRIFNKRNGLPDNKVITLAKDPQGAIWAGTDGYGAWRMNTNVGGVSFSYFTNLPQTQNSIPTNIIYDFLTTADGRFWMASEFPGVSLINLNNPHTKGEVHFENIPNDNPLAWQTPQKLDEDALGQLWVSTSEGYAIFDPTTRRTRQLTAGEGIIPPAHLPVHAFALNQSNGAQEAVFATSIGFIAGSITKVLQVPPLAKPIVTKFSVHDKDFSHLLAQSKIVLSHRQNLFSFAFGIPGHILPQHIRFEYMLKGVDQEWRVSDENLHASYTNIKGGSYEFMVRTIGAGLADQQYTMIIPITLQLPYWKALWFHLLLVAIGTLIIFSLMGYRLRQARKLHELQLAFNNTLKNELEIQTERVKNQVTLIENVKREKIASHYRLRLSESELKLIRSQMNPHFIFNVLNSIESYILDNEPKQAAEIVQKFAKLSRLILEYSAKSYITIRQEINLLELYVELESIRFNHQFTFSLHIDLSVNTDQLYIPPMLVQPLVENAIHHGIRERMMGGGCIQLSLFLVGKQVCFSLEDDGVGIENTRKRPKHPYKKTSMGISIINERLALMNKDGEAVGAKLEMKDLKHEDKTGTCVQLYIPLLTRPQKTDNKEF